MFSTGGACAAPLLSLRVHTGPSPVYARAGAGRRTLKYGTVSLDPLGFSPGARGGEVARLLAQLVSYHTENVKYAHPRTRSSLNLNFYGAGGVLSAQVDKCGC
jgi:hypothetical protein